MKQGAQFSARPSSYIAQEHVLHDAKHIYSLFLNNDYSKRLRSLTKPIIAGAGLSRLVPMQKAAGTRLVCDLIESGDDWMDHIMQWYVVAEILDDLSSLCCCSNMIKGVYRRRPQC